MKLAWLVVAAVAAFSNVPVAAGQPVYIGVYEPEYTDPHAAADSYDPATKTYHFRHGASRIRVAFSYSNGQWHALPDDDKAMTSPATADIQAYPSSLTLHDLSAGAGAIDARRGDWFNSKGQLYYKDVGVYEPAAPMPAILLRPANGAGDWAGNYRYAPVILTTTGGKLAPVVAVPFGSARLASLLPLLRQHTPTYAVCDQPEHQIGTRAWQAKDVHVQNAIRTSAGTLVELALDSKLDHCGFDDAGTVKGQDVVDCDYCSHWFLVAADNKVRALGNKMDLIGVGDLAGDGRTEWLFSQHAEDYDGYVLFADDFATRVDFSWRYH